jgi:glycosyltransferase involved in cell wall biosynthesis
MDTSVSVIVPCYSYGHYLAETLESILSQSVKPHEIIVVSDGAIDNSVEVARRYPVTIIEKENGGLASARNAGIQVSTGKYIMSVDSDDILRPDCIKEHLKLADEKSIVTCGLMAFGAENYTARPVKATVDILLKTNVIYSNTLFPKQAWKDVGGFDESETMRLGWEDREFWLSVLKAGYTSKVGDYIGLLWRRHPQAMSNATANPNAKLLQEYICNKHKSDHL